MPIIVSEIMKKIDERETQTNEKKTKKTEKKKEDKSYSERVTAKWFCCAFNAGLSPYKKKIISICFNESPLKMMKNAFYFNLKALLILKIFNFLS